MFVTIIFNTEYAGYDSRMMWYMKTLFHSKQNNWIIITHEYIKNHFSELQDNLTDRFFQQFEMRRFTLDEVAGVEQYFIPDELFERHERDLGSRTAYLWDLTENSFPVLESYLEDIILKIREKHPDDIIEGIFHNLESIQPVRNIGNKYGIPIIPYSFSAMRMTNGYRQTLYHAHLSGSYVNDDEVELRLSKFLNEKRSNIPFLTNEEIIAFIGKERTLPLIALINSKPQYELGVCCECFSVIPQYFIGSKYTDDDAFVEAYKLYGRNQIKVRSHAYQLDTIQVDRSEVHNDPASFILSCKRLTSVRSTISLKVMLWKRTAIMKKNILGFSFMCEKDYSSLELVDNKALNFYIFGCLIPSDLMFSDEYWKWRLTYPSEFEIYMRHLEFLCKTLNIDKEKLMQLNGKGRFRFLLESRHCDEQLIENLMSDEVVDNVNWDVASSRFDIVSDLETKSYWRIDTTNEDNDLTTNLAVDVKNAKTIMFYPLDDVAGFARLKAVYINGKQQVLDETMTSFEYMPKTKGAYSFKLDNPYSGKLLVECIWEYKKVFEFLNN